MIISTATTHSIIQLATTVLGELLAFVGLPSTVNLLSIAELVAIFEMFVIVGLLVIKYTWRDPRDQLEHPHISSHDRQLLLDM